MTSQTAAARLATRMTCLHAKLARKAQLVGDVERARFHTRRTVHWAGGSGICVLARHADGSITYRVYSMGLTRAPFRDVRLSPRMRGVLPTGLDSPRRIVVADGRTRNALLARGVADKVPGRLVALCADGERLARYIRAGH